MFDKKTQKLVEEFVNKISKTYLLDKEFVADEVYKILEQCIDKRATLKHE